MNTQNGDALGVAVVGAGYWGPNLARNFQASPLWRMQWLCDLDEDRAKRVLGSYSTVRTTPSLDDVLNDDSVHAVAIATPPSTHESVALAALDAGKHVLVEKPLADSYVAAERIVNRADELGLTLMSDHTYCYTPSVQKIRDLLADGTLGDLQYVDSIRINLGLVQRDVNVLWDLAPHDLSILEYILPEGIRPLAVAAHGADPIGAGQACVAYLSLQLPGDALAHFHVNWLSPMKVRTMLIGGSKRTLFWDDLSPLQRISVYDRGVDLTPREELDLEDRRAASISYRSGDVVAPALQEKEALRGVVEEFADAIRTHRAPMTDGRAGLRIVDILEAANRSLQFQGAVVPLRGVR